MVDGGPPRLPDILGQLEPAPVGEKSEMFIRSFTVLCGKWDVKIYLLTYLLDYSLIHKALHTKLGGRECSTIQISFMDNTYSY